MAVCYFITVDFVYLQFGNQRKFIEHNVAVPYSKTLAAILQKTKMRLISIANDNVGLENLE